MHDDEQKIRDLLDTWWRATEDGDVDTILGLMADDVVFLTPGQEPFGKKEFEEAARNGTMQVEGGIDIEELEIIDDWAWMRAHIEMTVTPSGDQPRQRSGHTLSILRRQPGGDWVIARDANLLSG